MENQGNSGKYYHCESFRKTTWTREEDKLFETAFVHVPENIEGRWQKIAAAVPGRTEEEVRARYDDLLHDLEEIESGRAGLPKYTDDYYGKELLVSSDYESGSKKIRRKKGTPWTEDEHRLFLKGLEVCGKGDWRSIQRKFVKTRTSTQVASHAQKYFLRQDSVSVPKRKRASIHDVQLLSPSHEGGAPPPQMAVQPLSPTGEGGTQTRTDFPAN